MRTTPLRITAGVLTTLLLTALTACGGGGDSSSTATANAGETTPPAAATAAPSSAASRDGTSDPTTTTDSPVATGASGPVEDPCELLTAKVAERALGVAVGDPNTLPGQGNSTCSYKPADPATRGLIYLTTYAVDGTEAVLAEAASTFRDAHAVDDLGDAAQVSIEAHAVGVLFDHTVFALGLVMQSPDGQIAPIDEATLVAAAQSVLDGR